MATKNDRINTTIYMPPDVHAALVEHAKSTEVSLSRLLVCAALRESGHADLIETLRPAHRPRHGER